MFEVVRKLKKIEKQFETEKDGKFKRLRFVYSGEKFDLSGKTIQELSPREVVKLKKFSKAFIENSFNEAESM